MRSGTIINSSRSTHKVGLYAFVYASKLSVAAVVLLFLSFFIQPFNKALANEDLPPEPEVPVVAAPVKEQTDKPKVETIEETSVEESELLSADVAVDDSAVEIESPEEVNSEPTSVGSGGTKSSTTDNTSNAPSNNEPNQVGTSTSSNVASGANSASPNSTNTGTTTSTQSTSSTTQSTASSTSSNTSSTTNSTSGGESNDQPEIPTTTEESSVDSEIISAEYHEPVDDTSSNDESSSGDNDSSEADPADTSDELVNEVELKELPDTIIQSQYLVTEENYYQFSRQSCAPVGDGTYHCSTNTSVAVDPQAIVYADKDEDGDMEIYMRTSKGKVEKLSDNNYDDTSPHFSAEALKVVWQQLVDGRYQVISYDLEEQQETQLTFSRTNNMEPKVSKEGIVWQAWDGNDWEIMYFDGAYTDQLTDNDAQDVTPVIEDDYILWSILGGTDQEARVYSIKSGEVMTIAGHEGGTIANPRFVLVYDTKFENGDVVTKGFDPATGISAPISAQAAPQPIEIPKADPIGEIRALIQNKSNQKEQNVISDPVPDTGTTTVNTATSTSTSSSTDTLNIKVQQAELEQELAPATTTDNSVPDFELTEFDLVITHSATSTSSSRDEGALDNPLLKTEASSTQP